MNPLAVIITCYNKQPYLGEAVQSALANDPAEIIIVDDGSLDGSMMEAERLAALDSRIRLIPQLNLGAAAARNAGWQVSTAPWLVFLDGDDRISPSFAQKTLAAASASGAEIVSGHARMFGSRSDIWRPQRWDPYFIRYDNSLPICSLVHRTLVESATGFNVQLPFAEDWDLWIRLGSRYPVVVQLAEVVYEYRRTTEQNLSQHVDDKWGLTAALMMLANQALYNVEDLRFAVSRFLESGQEWRAPLARHAQRYPHSALLALIAGLVAEGMGNTAGALSQYAAVLQCRETDVVALWRIGLLLKNSNQPQQAYQLLHQARVVRPDMNFVVATSLEELSGNISTASVSPGVEKS